jgi:hypothetical protein
MKPNLSRRPTSLSLAPFRAPAWHLPRLPHWQTIFSLLAAYLALPAVGIAQVSQAAAVSSTPANAGFTVTERSAHHRVWSKTEWETGRGGIQIPHVHKFTELATGLHFTRNGQWAETSTQITLLPDGLGAAATNGPHQVFFPADIYEGAIQTITPDGKTLTSRPAVLSYFDGTNNIPISFLTNSIGQILPSGNQVIYTNCFPGLADLLCTYRKSGFECDLIFRSPPPASPEDLGLDPANCRIQLWTEWFNTADPQITPAFSDQADGLTDSTLTFGSVFKMTRGKAFSVGLPSQQKSASSKTPPPQLRVFKTWQKWNNRSFLIEELPFLRIAPQLAQLSAATRLDPSKLLAHQSINPSIHQSNPRHQSINPTIRRSFLPILPPARAPHHGTAKFQLARADLAREPGVLLDYEEENGELGSFTFQKDTTYWISGAFNIDNLATFEGNTVIKLPEDCSGGIYINTTTVCATGPYEQAILTSENDNSAGESLPWSSGSPAAGCSDSPWLYSPCSCPIRYMRFAYGGSPLYVWADGVLPAEVWHCQFYQCGPAVAVEPTELRLRNVLFAQCTSVAQAENSSLTVRGEHVTADGCNLNTVTSACLTNSILTGFSSTVPAPGTLEPTLVVPPSSTGVYQSAGAGNYYLADASPYRGTGRTNITPALLADLRQKTTSPPIVIANTTITNDTTFIPQAQRETGQIDIGWAYDALDYHFNNVTNAANLSFAPGTACAWSVASGISLQINDTYNVSFNGTASAPCYWVRQTTVQEAPAPGGEPWAPASITASTWPDFSQTPVVSLRFTRFSLPANDLTYLRDNNGYLIVHARDCEFWTGSCGGYCSQLNFTNCLFDRPALWTAWDGNPTTNCTFVLQNCLVRGGFMNPNRTGSDPNGNYPLWFIHDTAFDGANIYFSDAASGDSRWTQFDYNAYRTNCPTTVPAGTHNQTVTNFNWQTNGFANFYLPANSSLINTGSMTANLLGLYHYTVTTNLDANGLQINETNSIVDIGFHRVATDANGNPIDTSGKGIPDYLQDLNGNGVVDPGDLNWLDPYDLGLKVLITRPKNNSTLP